jgi:hypothetical protein
MTEVIVYRNPMEAMFWNSMMNGGAAIFFFVIFAVLFWAVVFSRSHKLILKHTKQTFKQAEQTALWVSGIATAVLVAAAHFYNIYG